MTVDWRAFLASPITAMSGSPARAAHAASMIPKGLAVLPLAKYQVLNTKYRL